MIFGVSSLPFWARYRLATSVANVPDDTKSILVMGGGGFPSEAVLMRLWYAVEMACDFPDSKIIIATPGNFNDSTSTLFQMHHYLMKSGIAPQRIIYESKGLNTRHQALMVYEMYQHQQFELPLLVVTSPAHLYRSVKSFEKVGFINVGGKPAFESMLETDLRLKEENLGGNELIPDAGNSISIRYQFWDYLKYEVDVAREYIAITYYRLKGWI
jgi:uncharacterized SAM-binding protein YcdF (DUF218 family)